MPVNHGFEQTQDHPELILENDLPKSPAAADVKVPKIHTFDEAVALAKVGIFHYFVQIVSGMCLMTAVVEVMGISIIMPFISRDLPSTIAEKGILASCGFLGIVLSSHAVGFLSDTWGRAKMLRTTLAMSFITSFIAAFSYNIWMLIVLRFITGFIMSSCMGSVYNYVGEFHSSKTRAKYVTMLSMFLQLGMIFMPAVAIGILPLQLDISIFGLQFESWRLLLLIFSCMRIFAIIGLFVLPETPKYVLVQGDHELALKTLQLMYSKNTSNPKCDYPVTQIACEVRGDNLKSIKGVRDAVELIWKQTAPLFFKERILHTLNICGMMLFVNGISHGVYMWFPTILNQQLANADRGLTTCEIMQLPQDVFVNVSQQVAETAEEILVDTTMLKVLIVIGAVFSVSYFFLSLIINVVGKRRLLIALIVISGCSCVALQYMTSISWAVVILTIIMSISNCTGIVGTMAFEFFPTNVSGMAMSLIMMVARIGSFAGSSLFGVMMYAHCNSLFYISCALCILMLILASILPGTTKKPPTINAK